MPSGYDGEDFVGLDDEAIQAAGASAQPWDTWLDNASASNLQNLGELGHGVTWALLTNGAGDYDTKAGVRPYTSLGFSSVFLVPWYFLEDVSNIRLGLVARVGDETGNGLDVRVRLQRRSADLASVIGTSSTSQVLNSEGASPQFQPALLDLPLPDQASDVVGALHFCVAGVSPAEDVATTLGGGTNRSADIYQAGDVDFYEDSTFSRPDDIALDLQFTRLTGGGGDVDHVFLPQGLGSADGEVIGVLGPTQPVPNQLARRGLSFLQLKSATLWQTFDDTTRPDVRVYAAQKPLVGEVAVTHALRLDAIYTRPRPVWMGPVGQQPDPEAGEWPTGYTYRFNRVYGDDETEQTLLVASLHLETVNPILRVLAYVAPLHLYPTAQTEGQEAADLTPLVTWEHALSLDQMEDGDASWAAAASRGTSTALVRHGHSPYDRGSLLCVSEGAVRYPQSGDAAGLGYAYREGQLADADLGKLELIALTVETTYDPTTDRPLRLKWTTTTQTPAEQDWQGVADAPNPFFPDTETARTLSTLGLVVVGVTIWEIPQ
jgi:hypothetical protein